jgi:hypothetical protein
MNAHLTEQQLIDYQFKLAPDAAMEQARAHLDTCEACRTRLQALARKFASLELLRDEITASEALVAQTVRHATTRPARRVISLPPVAWLGATAAALVLGFALLLVSDYSQKHPADQYATSAPAPQENAPAQPQSAPALRTETKAAGAPERPVAVDTFAKDTEVALPPAPAQPPMALAPTTGSTPGGSLKAEGLGDGSVARASRPRFEGKMPSKPRGQDDRDTTRGRQVALDDATRATPPETIEEQPPFAPASAIELVVLPRRENVQLTIYSGAGTSLTPDTDLPASTDLTLVRERRNLTLKRGWNWLQFMWANTLIDPTSLNLEPLEQKEQVQVQQLVFPPRLRELGRWLIHSEISGQVPFELTYFTSGLSWRAFYMGTLSQDEKTMHLQGYVRVQNKSGEDYENAQTRLIVGRVHLLDWIRALAERLYPYGVPAQYGAGRRLTKSVVSYALPPQFTDKVGPKDIRKEGLSEYFLYTIEGTETIPNGWAKRLLSFDMDDIPVRSLYKYDDKRWGRETRQFLSFANDEKHKLGQTPLPDGTFRIYGRTDGEGHLSYVGGAQVTYTPVEEEVKLPLGQSPSFANDEERRLGQTPLPDGALRAYARAEAALRLPYAGGAGMKYIPVGEEVELELGPARLVEVKPVLMDYRTENYVFDPNGQITGWDTVKTWKIEIANARTLPVEIEITRGFATAYWTLKMQDGEAPYEKHDATHVRFKLTVEPRSKRTFEYTVTTRHGTREQAGAGGQNTTN